MSATSITPYLFFGGRCEEAIDFYRTALGARVEFKLLFKDSPEPLPPGVLQPGFEHKVMHATLSIGNTKIMATDGCNDKSQLSGFSLALSFPTAAETDPVFDALAKGGHVQMPLGKTFWSPRYGMVTDRFKISWMVTVDAELPD